MKSIYTYHKELLLILLSFIFFVTSLTYAQTTTTIDGSNGIWTTAANWSNGVPSGGGSIVTVNKALQLNANLSFGSGTGGTYTINSPVTDITGGSTYGITVSNSGTLDVNSNLTIEGSISVTNSGTLIVESGDTLTVGGASISQTTTITIKSGGVVIVNGNMNVSNASGITCDGELIINGNYVSSNTSTITGLGTMTTTGTITSNQSSLIFGSSNDCTTGPCSARNLCSANANKIAASQSICSGAQPAQLTDVSNPGGTYTIQWQSSITSGTGGFSNITSANSLNYQPTSLSQNTWYRRVITKGTCIANSPSLQILVGTPTITSQPVDFSICGTSGTAKFSIAATGGTQLTYQWQLNGSNISNNSTYSGATTSTLTVTATSAMNGNTYRCIVSNAGCSATSTSNSARLIISSAAPTAPIANAGSGASCFQITANWTASTNSTGYYLDVAIDNAFSSMVSGYNSKNVGNVTTYTITGLNLSITYYYRVRAYNSCGASSNSNVITFATIPGCTYTWVGSVSTDWSTPGNWSGNLVPTTSNDVLIPTGPSNMPVILGNANSRNLIVEQGASLKNKVGGRLSINGNFTNNGSYTDTGTVVLNGNATHVITGVNTFNNLTLNNPAGAKLNNPITINGILTLTQGTVNPNGNLITLNLNSGAISGEGSGAISEPIKVIKTVGTKWHHLGNPFGTNIVLSQVTDNITIANGVLFKYDETNPSTVMEDGWVEIPPANFNSTTMMPMTGYDVFFWAKKTTLDMVGTYNHNFSTNVSLTNTSSGEQLSDGWNFLSNPYPSTIDWDAASGWSKSGINNAVYVYDKSNDRYMSYIDGIGTNGGSRYISSIQGFWVKCSSSSGSIGINNNARVTSPIMKLYKNQESEYIKLSVSSDGFSDETIIKLNSEGTSNFDQSFDAYKLKNSGMNPNLRSKLNGIEYSINTISNTIIDEIIPIKITTSFVGQYSMSIDLDKFQSDIEVTLIDKKFNVAQDLKLNPNYLFENNNLDTNRFYIRLKNKTSVSTGLISKNDNNVFIGSDGSVVTILLNTDHSIADMSLLNMLGNEVYRNNQVKVKGGLISEQIDVQTSGTYIVKLMIGEKIFTGRVFIK